MREGARASDRQPEPVLAGASYRERRRKRTDTDRLVIATQARVLAALPRSPRSWRHAAHPRQPAAGPAPTWPGPARQRPALRPLPAHPPGTSAEATSAEPSARRLARGDANVRRPVVVDPGDVPAGATVIRWYCCLGAGDAPEAVEVEKQVIEDWNSTHDDIKIAGEFVLYAQAYDTLAAEVAGGNPPDIVGPVGYGGANAFPDQWLDLQPLIDSNQLRHVPVGKRTGRLLQGRRHAGWPAVRHLSLGGLLPEGHVRGDRSR